MAIKEGLGGKEHWVLYIYKPDESLASTSTTNTLYVNN